MESLKTHELKTTRSKFNEKLHEFDKLRGVQNETQDILQASVNGLYVPLDEEELQLLSEEGGTVYWPVTFGFE